MRALSSRFKALFVFMFLQNISYHYGYACNVLTATPTLRTCETVSNNPGQKPISIVSSVNSLSNGFWFLPQLHYLRLPKDICDNHVILMDATVATGAAGKNWTLIHKVMIAFQGMQAILYKNHLVSGYNSSPIIRLRFIGKKHLGLELAIYVVVVQWFIVWKPRTLELDA